MQFIDLAAQQARIAPRLAEAMRQVLAEGRYIGGPQVAELEQRLAAYVGRRFCIACASGTDALILPLLAMGVGPGDAVFVPDFTFFATAEAVAAVGAVPVFVDVRPDTYNMDPDDLRRKIEAVRAAGDLTPRAVIPVDLFGQPADYTALLPLAAQYGLRVIEDAAQGFGGTWQGRKACAFGDVSATSFFPAKPLGCYGDGGAMFTDDPALDALLRSLRVHGSDPADKYNNLRVGRNSRLDTLQAAVLLCKLEVFNDELAARHAAAARYDQLLGPLAGIPAVAPGATSSYAQYTLRLPQPARRPAVIAALREQGVPAMVYYPRPLHAQTAFAGAPDYGPCPAAEAAAAAVLSVPMHPYLTPADQTAVRHALAAALA